MNTSEEKRKLEKEMASREGEIRRSAEEKAGKEIGQKVKDLEIERSRREGAIDKAAEKKKI